MGPSESLFHANLVLACQIAALKSSANGNMMMCMLLPQRKAA